MHSLTPPSRRPLRHIRGLSLVEMLVGITVGLFILVGVLRFFANYLDNSRRMMIETRIHQDLRTVADLVARDLRRAGYWRAPLTGLGPTATLNPYRAVSPTGTAASTTVLYSYSRDPSVDESLGFKLNGGAVEALNAGAWQALTDTSLMTVTAFNVTPSRMCVSLSATCTAPGLADACTTAGAAYPKLWVRRYHVDLTAQSTADSRVVRRITESVRVRNDEIENLNGCPP